MIQETEHIVDTNEMIICPTEKLLFAQQTLEEIKQLAEKMWEGCHGCDEMDKYMWIGGFVEGYLTAKSD